MKNRNFTVSALALIALAASATQTLAQSTYTPYAFTNFAGMPGAPGSADGAGGAARFSIPEGVAVDAEASVYVADTSNQTVRKITPAGVVTTLAGLAGNVGSADGTGSAARFRGPIAVAVDSGGNVYVAEWNNCTIRKITPAGVVTTLAGLAGSYGSTDGTGSAARFGNAETGPTGVAVDSAGNVYVADYVNCTIRKVTPAGVVSTLAGLAGNPGSADGTDSEARLYCPTGVAVDSMGNVYVTDSVNCTIRKITPAGVVTTLAGLAGNAGSADGTGSAARFDWPRGVAVDSTGSIYVADQHNATIRRITPQGVVTTLAGLAGTTGTNDGTGSAARFSSPQGVAVGSTGSIYVVDTDNNRITKGTPLDQFANGLLAYYPFSDDGKDQSGHGLDLTLSNILFSTVGSGGEMRRGASFDGQSSYGIVHQPLIVGLTNWTWSVWLYSPQGSTESTSWQAIYDEGNQEGSCFSIAIFQEMLHIAALNVGLPNNWKDAFVPYVLTNGWNYLALTLANGDVGSGTLSIFFNGVLTNTAVLQNCVPPDTSPRLGVVGNGWDYGNPSYPTAPWNGSMADLRFYNRALSSNEVAQLYALESTPPAGFQTNGLVAYYPLTADGKDQSGHGLDLTLSNVVFSAVGSAGDMRRAASFDGVSSYGIVNQTLITGQTNWTWSAWIYSPPGVTENPSPQSLYQEGNEVGNCFFMDILATNQMLVVGAWNVGLPNNWKDASVPYGLTNGWNHLALTLANGGVGTGTLSIFFNGVLGNTAALQSVNLGDTSRRFGVVGNGWYTGGNFTAVPWKGSMADLRFYNRALSTNEVAQLYAIESTPTLPPCIPRTATATARVDNGFVVGAAITDGGSCYTNTPTVRIMGDGSGAQAVAVVSSGVVTAVNVLDAGSGYSTAIIIIEPPFIAQPTMRITALFFGPLVTVLELDLANLSPYDKYQLEFSPVAGGTWTNLGTSFIPTAATSTQYANASGNTGFFRVRYVP